MRSGPEGPPHAPALRAGAWLRAVALALALGPALAPAAEGTGVVDDADPALAAAIDRLPVLDVHTHIEDNSLGAPPKDPADPLGNEPFTYPLRLQYRNPERLQAWSALYGAPVADFERGTLTAVRARKDAQRARLGTAWPAWVIDRSNTRQAFINAAELGPTTPRGRFQLVVYVDPLLSPFSKMGEPVQGALERLKLHALPATLDGYVSGVIRPFVHQARAERGAVAVKTAMAYYRPLAVDIVEAAEAEPVYRRLRQGGTVAPAAYRRLQDFLIRATAQAAGAEQLPLHIHTGLGADPWFQVAGANPLLLEPLVTHPSCQGTRFVMIHGGWPFEHQLTPMLMHPNVYAEFSAQVFLRPDRAIAATLRDWLGFAPHKLMFGSDAYADGSPLAGWEETQWLAVRTGRRALALALSGMLRDGEVSRAQAEAIAADVLAGTAQRLHPLATSAP